MCKVDKKTITRVNINMISRVKLGTIHFQKSLDGYLVVPIHALGSYPYRISIDRVNEIYGKARRSVIGK